MKKNNREVENWKPKWLQSEFTTHRSLEGFVKDRERYEKDQGHPSPPRGCYLYNYVMCKQTLSGFVCTFLLALGLMFWRFVGELQVMEDFNQTQQLPTLQERFAVSVYDFA